MRSRLWADGLPRYTAIASAPWAALIAVSRSIATATAAALAGRTVAIVDSASAMAEAAAAALGAGDDRRDRPDHPGALACFATDISRLDELAPRFLGERMTSFELVDL